MSARCVKKRLDLRLVEEGLCPMFCLVPGLSSQTIDMLAQVNADPLLRIVQNLPLSSITRLRTSSSYFNNFFAADGQALYRRKSCA